VVFDDATSTARSTRAVFMIFSNNGERCTAGSRILVQRSIYAKFRRGLRRPRQQAADRRPARRGDDRRPDDQPRAPGQGAQLHRAGPQEGATLLAAASTRPALPARSPGNYVAPRLR